jgi:hypothetical protein
MVHGAWCMVHGAWCMVHGAWCVVRGAWCVVRGARCVVHAAQGGVQGCTVQERGKGGEGGERKREKTVSQGLSDREKTKD